MRAIGFISHLNGNSWISLLSWSKVKYFFFVNISMHPANSTGTIPSRRSWATSGGKPVVTLKYERFSDKGQAFFTPQHASPFLHASATCTSCCSSDLRGKTPSLTSFDWLSVRVAVQNLQKYCPEKFSTKPAKACAPRLSATTYCTVPLINVFKWLKNTPCCSKMMRSFTRGSKIFL